MKQIVSSDGLTKLLQFPITVIICCFHRVNFLSSYCVRITSLNARSVCLCRSGWGIDVAVYNRSLRTSYWRVYNPFST